MADDRDQELIKIAMYKESLDTIRVHNPTNEDFIIQWDRSKTNERWMIPSQTKDTGKGHGNADVPRYVAQRYITKIIVKLINDESARLWEKEKTKYRLDERPQFEEKLALRTDNQQLWEQWMPKVWLGVVTRYGGQDVPEPEEKQIEPRSGNLVEDVMSRLNLNDKLIESSKEELINAITE
jgi:hypothetical protein